MPTCIRGVRGLENTARKMPLEIFEQVIAKVKAERYTRVGLYNWTEPFLNRTLQDYVAVVRQAELPCDISTTLSLRHIDNLEKTLLAGLNLMTVSMSGATQATYEINHVDGNIEYAFVNLQRIREVIDRHSLQTVINMRFIQFAYNAGEIEDLRCRAEQMGFAFEVVAGQSHPKSGHMLNDMAEANFKKAMGWHQIRYTGTTRRGLPIDIRPGGNWLHRRHLSVLRDAKLYFIENRQVSRFVGTRNIAS